MILKGKNIELHPFTIEDADKLSIYLLQPGLLDFIGKHFLSGEGSLKGWIENNFKTNNFIFFSIKKTGTNNSIGALWLANMDFINGKAQVKIIGETFKPGSDYLTEALTLLVHHCFYSLRLNKLYTDIPSKNTTLTAIFELSGFQKECTLKEEFFSDGKFEDANHMTVFSKKSQSSVKSSVSSSSQLPKGSTEIKGDKLEFQWFQSQKKL